MRALTIAVVIGVTLAGTARAQSTITETTVQPSTPTTPSTPSTPAAPSTPSASPAAPPGSATPPPLPPPSSASASSSSLSLTAPSLTVSRARPSPEMIGRWRTARALSVTGSILNVIGTGLSLASLVYVAATNYPPNANDLLSPAAKPSDPGPALAYAGASASAAGFILSAAGLGYEHHLLDMLGADPGRGMFGVGTAFGVVGFVGVGASYFFGLTDYLNPHDQSVALLTTSLLGTALCAIGGLLYAIDSSHVKRAWELVSTF